MKPCLLMCVQMPVRLGRARQGIFSPMLPELAGLDAERIVQVSGQAIWGKKVEAVCSLPPCLTDENPG